MSYCVSDYYNENNINTKRSKYFSPSIKLYHLMNSQNVEQNDAEHVVDEHIVDECNHTEHANNIVVNNEHSNTEQPQQPIDIYFEQCRAEYYRDKILFLLDSIKCIIDNNFYEHNFLNNNLELTIYNGHLASDELVKASSYIDHIEEFRARQRLYYLIEDCYDTIHTLEDLSSMITRTLIERQDE